MRAMRPMRLCDAHTHFFSRSFFDLLAAQAARARGGAAPSILDDAVRKAGIEMPDPSPRKHAERWKAELDRHGVHRAVAFASLPGEASAVAEACAFATGRLIPFVLVDPTTPEGIEAGRRALAEQGFRGLLLFPALHRFDPADRSLDPLYRDAGERRALVVVHCGILQIKLRDLLGLRPEYDLRTANPISVIAAAERHRGTTFVLPHFGCGFFREALLAGAQSPNILVDTSSSNSWMAAQPEEMTLEKVFRKALDVFGPRRILFGTDSSTFPRGWRFEILEAQRRAVDACGLGEADTARIFGENLMDLLHLS